MRYLVMSDIHANLPALEAVLNDAGSFDAIWCLGDLVGYGPNPNECVERIQDYDNVCLSGNHDWAALGRLTLDQFNIDARQATIWTREQLLPQSREYMLPLPPSTVQGEFTMAHGSPRAPVWEYILDSDLALINFGHFDTNFCLVGHTHIPAIFAFDAEQNRCFPLVTTDIIQLDSTRLILNPGSVGQPRDGDPRASYAILDLGRGTWERHRVPYPFSITQERMRARQLPPRLVDRLARGR